MSAVKKQLINWSNNTINTDSKKRCSFVAPFFTASYGER
jgi:hypothetical protein